MKDEQEQNVKEKIPLPKEDPRIDKLIRAYRSLAVKVNLLQEQIQKQDEELTRQKERIVDAILGEEQRKKITEDEGRDPSLPLSASMPNKPEVKKEPEEQKPKPRQSENAKSRPKKGRTWAIVGNIMFYGALVFLIAAALLIRTTSTGAPKSFAGYSGMIVLTESMQSEIPKGSLVIAKTVDAKTLQIGDDITYMANQTTSVTHRIVGIMEDYENTGQRAFWTQGIMNAQQDSQPVPAVNVVGKVVFHSEVLGVIANFIRSYWPLLLFFLVVGVVLFHVLGRILGNDRKDKKKRIGI